MSMPAVAAAVDAAPLTTPLRLHSACMDDRIERPDLSWISVPTTFWATSTTASKKPTQKMHAARASPLPDQPAKATTVARTMVPPTATGTAGKRAISRDGNTEEVIAPIASEATMRPNTQGLRLNRSIMRGYQVDRVAKTAPLLMKKNPTPATPRGPVLNSRTILSR